MCPKETGLGLAIARQIVEDKRSESIEVASATDRKLCCDRAARTRYAFSDARTELLRKQQFAVR